MMRTVLLLSLVVAVYCFPTNSKSKVTDLKRSVNKRSTHVQRNLQAKRSSFDTFTKSDLDKNDFLDDIEMAYFFYSFGMDIDEAHMLGIEQLLNADLNNDGRLSRWEWERNDDVGKPYTLYY